MEGGGGKKWSSLTCVECPVVIIGGGALRVGVNGAKLFDSEMGGSLLVDVCISIVGGGGGRMSSLVLKGDVSKSKLLIPELVDSTTTSFTDYIHPWLIPILMPITQMSFLGSIFTTVALTLER